MATIASHSLMTVKRATTVRVDFSSLIWIKCGWFGEAAVLGPPMAVIVGCLL